MIWSRISNTSIKNGFAGVVFLRGIATRHFLCISVGFYLIYAYKRIKKNEKELIYDVSKIDGGC